LIPEGKSRDQKVDACECGKVKNSIEAWGMLAGGERSKKKRFKGLGRHWTRVKYPRGGHRKSKKNGGRGDGQNEGSQFDVRTSVAFRELSMK